MTGRRHSKATRRRISRAMRGKRNAAGPHRMSAAGSAAIAEAQRARALGRLASRARPLPAPLRAPRRTRWPVPVHVRRTLRDWIDAPGSEPEVVIVLDREEFRRLLNLRSEEQVTTNVRRLEAAGVLLSAGDRYERWVRRHPTDRRGPGRDRLLGFRLGGGSSDPLRLRQVARGLAYDEREARRAAARA